MIELTTLLSGAWSLLKEVSLDIGAEIQQPMASVLMGGLIVSTPIVLVLLPALYAKAYGIFNKSKDVRV